MEVRINGKQYSTRRFVEVNEDLVKRFKVLKPRDGNDKEISLKKYVNDLLADRLTGIEEDDDYEAAVADLNPEFK